MTAAVPEFDVAVIGAGIHGAGVAQAAAAAGHSVVILEQSEAAAGTSSRSSKLIHGGLRYLESAQFALVRESLRERATLLRIAPDLVHRQRFFIPIYSHASRGRWWVGAGLLLYAFLGGFNADVRFRTVPRSAWTELDGLASTGLTSVYEYTDAQTDDVALTRAVLRSARELGAVWRCPARVMSGRLHPHHGELTFREQGQSHVLTARAIVNAAGPWAPELAARFAPPLPMEPVERLQGAHLELPGRPKQGCYYLEVPSDGRAVFVMPWRSDRTLVGTTENPYEGDPANVAVLDTEKDYLLSVYRRYFPTRSTEILDAWAGLRVLPAGRRPAFRRSRETRLPVDRHGLPVALSILGGKLTGYRATAERVMGLLKPSLPARTRRADTRSLPLRPDAGGSRYA